LFTGDFAGYREECWRRCDPQVRRVEGGEHSGRSPYPRCTISRIVLRR